MNQVHISITSRSDDSEQAINIFCSEAARQVAIGPLVTPSPYGNTADQYPDHDTHVAGDATDMAEALAAISGELGCANTLDDMLHAIDALRAAPAPKLEWSHTLCDGKRVDHATAEKACAALGEGWRLPTRMELESILDLSRHSPAVDTTRFPDTKSDPYWTSTIAAWSSVFAWIVDFDSGVAYDFHRDDDLAFVRAVRAAPAGQ